MCANEKEIVNPPTSTSRWRYCFVFQDLITWGSYPLWPKSSQACVHAHSATTQFSLADYDYDLQDYSLEVQRLITVLSIRPKTVRVSPPLHLKTEADQVQENLYIFLYRREPSQVITNVMVCTVGAQTFLWRRDTSITLGWFVGCPWKNNSKWYI